MTLLQVWLRSKSSPFPTECIRLVFVHIQFSSWNGCSRVLHVPVPRNNLLTDVNHILHALQLLSTLIRRDKATRLTHEVGLVWVAFWLVFSLYPGSDTTWWLVTETLTGLATIRAYREQTRSVQDAETGLDLENRAYYMTISIQRWLAVRLDVFANILIFGIALFAAGFRHTINPAKVGVVLSYTLSSMYFHHPTCEALMRLTWSHPRSVTQMFCRYHSWYRPFRSWSLYQLTWSPSLRKMNKTWTL